MFFLSLLSESPDEFDTLRDSRLTRRCCVFPITASAVIGNTQRDFVLELAETEEHEKPVAWKLPVSSYVIVALLLSSPLCEALVGAEPMPNPVASTDP